jgi:hypothetical protein
MQTASAARAPAVQLDYIVPSSRSPPKLEWTRHYWYVMFAAAMQASDTATDADAALLVQFFASLQVALCCPKCREHYRTNFARSPYTAAHAKDLDKSVAWVRALRFAIEDQIAEAKRAAAVAAGNAFPAQSNSARTCTPAYPGAVFTGARTSLHQQLDAAIAHSVATIRDRGDEEPCACTLGGRQYKPPAW